MLQRNQASGFAVGSAAHSVTSHTTSTLQVLRLHLQLRNAIPEHFRLDSLSLHRLLDVCQRFGLVLLVALEGCDRGVFGFQRYGLVLLVALESCNFGVFGFQRAGLALLVTLQSCDGSLWLPAQLWCLWSLSLLLHALAGLGSSPGGPWCSSRWWSWLL